MVYLPDPIKNQALRDLLFLASWFETGFKVLADHDITRAVLEISELQGYDGKAFSERVDNVSRSQV